MDVVRVSKVGIEGINQTFAAVAADAPSGDIIVDILVMRCWFVQ